MHEAAILSDATGWPLPGPEILTKLNHCGPKPAFLATASLNRELSGSAKKGFDMNIISFD